MKLLEWGMGVRGSVFEKYAMKFIGIYHQMNCNPMWWLSLLFYQLLALLLLFPFFDLMPFFSTQFFRSASHRMKWNCIEKRDYVSGSMRSVNTLQIYLKQFYCACQTKSTLDLCTISLILLLALLCTFTFNVLRSFVKTKSNICQAIEKNECKFLEIEIRRVSALFALPPKCSITDATAKHTHLPAYTQTK